MHKLNPHICVLTVMMATPALAYFGPGATAGTIAIVLGVLASVFFAFVGIIWYPVKRLVKRRKPAAVKKAAETAQDAECTGS